jgi:hypothetical protein
VDQKNEKHHVPVQKNKKTYWGQMDTHSKKKKWVLQNKQPYAVHKNIMGTENGHSKMEFQKNKGG